MLQGTKDILKSYPSKRSNILVSNSRAQHLSNDHSEYQIVVQFELKRQREKTRNLEERLRNKEVFIQQMKQYQEELTIAFQNCQEELIITKKQVQKLALAERDYIKQIQELKHLLIVLEDQITQKDRDLNRRNYNSASKDHRSSPVKVRQLRSKTLMNDQESPRPRLDLLEQEVLKESKKITKFIRQFLQMSSLFVEVSENQPLKNQLKNAWKWIKDVVKQWNQLKNEKQVWDFFLENAQQKCRISSSKNLDQQLETILSFVKAR